MIFSTPSFLFFFLPLSLISFLLLPSKWRNPTLLFFSFLFYFSGENQWPPFILALASTFLHGWMLEKAQPSKLRKLLLASGVGLNIAIILYYKYSFFILGNLPFLDKEQILSLQVVLPLGISFYIFQCVAYCMDVYNKKHKAEKNLINFCLFISFFPQLIAGPIVGYDQIRKSLLKISSNLNDQVCGLQRFIFGLGKKLIIANPLGAFADQMMATNTMELDPYLAWFAVICYSFQIYYDFSGYSDMAIGLGRFFGLKIPENFNYPYASRSIKEFWRKWHMTLSYWFRDYLYIPLGGSRKGPVRTYLNLLIVFFLTGLWHGASWNFVIWGLFHGAFLIFERLWLGSLLERLWRPVQHIYLIVVVVSGWVLFKIEDLSQALSYLNVLFNPGKYTAFNRKMFSSFIDKEVFILFIIAAVLSVPSLQFISNKLNVSQKSKSNYSLFASAFILMLCFIYLAGSTYNPFIYFRF